MSGGMVSSDKVVTIFGGSGFVGRHVVSRFAEAGWGVRIAVRDADRASFLTHCGDVGRVVPISVDVSNDASLKSVIHGVDVVVNLVGILSAKGRQGFDRLHAKLPGRIAEFCRESKVTSLIQMSAIGADENSSSAYGRTKAEGEISARRGFSDTIVLRPSIVFGPEDDFFNRFAGMAKISPFLPLVAGGHAKFQPVYVGDVAEAVYLAATSGRCFAGKTFELGGLRVLSFRECLDLVQEYTGLSRGYLTIPMAIAMIQAVFMEFLPKPPLTRDQLRMLKSDNVVSGSFPGLMDLGISPTGVELVLPSYLRRFKEG